MRSSVALVIVLTLGMSTCPFAARADDISLAGRLLAGRSFPDIYAALQDGSLDVVSPDELIREVYLRPGALTPLERDAIAEATLGRVRAERDAAELEDVAATMVALFAQLVEPGLRAEVLLLGDQVGSEGTAGALYQSAERVARALATGSGSLGPGTIEMEGLTVARLAATYPSVELAENLRTIAVYSRDRRLVEAARTAAYEVMRLVSE